MPPANLAIRTPFPQLTGITRRHCNEDIVVFFRGPAFITGKECLWQMGMARSRIASIDRLAG